MSLGTISSLAAQASTHVPLLLFDIVSVEDGSALHLASLPCAFGGNSYQAAILGISGFDVDLTNSQLGVMAIQNLTLTLGDADATYTNWDNTHFFKGAAMTVTLVIYDENAKAAASSDSRIIFKGTMNAPDSVTPDQMTVSAYNRFNATFLLIPTSRVSQFSQTVFPPEGANDCDDGNANPPASKSSVGFHLFAPGGAASDVALYLPYNSCGYSPIRGAFGFAGSNPLGNTVLTSIPTANIFSSTTIGSTSLAMVAGANVNHVVVILSGTGAGQMRRVAANTSTTLTVANPFTITPDATSQFTVLFGYCDHTSTSCQARGMFGLDASARSCFRFRGIDFVPTDFRYEQPSGHHTLTSTNPEWAKYNEVIPLVYGTARVNCKILFSQTANDTRGQAVVCEGPVASITNMIIGTETIPFDASYPHVDTTTGKWKAGLGAIGQNYTDVWFPNGDPYSAIAMVSFNFPPAFAGNSDSFQVSVLVQGMMLPQYNSSGAFTVTAFTDNPAWIILDALRRAGWQKEELNIPSFYAFSVYAAQNINVNISSTCTALKSRFRISSVLDQQLPVGDFLTSLLGACRGVLSYDSSGLLRIDCLNRLTNTTLGANVSIGTNFVTVEDGAGITIGTQLTIDSGANQETVTVLNVQLSANAFQIQAAFTKAHSTGAAAVAAPAFSFDLSSIAQDSNHYPMITRTSMNTSQTPNDFVVEFQDSLRQYVQDSAELMDTAEANNFGAKVTGQLDATGFEDVDSAVRIERLELYKGHGRRDSANKIVSRGNLFATLMSSLKAINVGIGQIVGVSYAKEGWASKPFRVVHVSPVQDPQFPYWMMQFTLQEHDDQWYDDVNGNVAPPSGPNAIPLPPPPRPPLPGPPRMRRMPVFN